METTYFRGDECEYTGKKQNLYGATFYEVKMLEGAQQGQLKVIRRAPMLRTTLESMTEIHCYCPRT